MTLTKRQAKVRSRVLWGIPGALFLAAFLIVPTLGYEDMHVWIGGSLWGLLLCVLGHATTCMRIDARRDE